MPQSIPSTTIPWATPGHLTKSYIQGTEVCSHKLSRGPGFDRSWEVTKIQHTELILHKIALSVSLQSMKQNLLSVLRTVKCQVMFCDNLSHGIENLRRLRSDLLNPKFGSQKSALL